MLYKITWQHYLLYVAIALLIWYGIIIWLYYRDEAKRLLEQSKGRVATDEEFTDEAGEEEDLLGKPAEEYGVSTIESQALSFGHKLPTDKQTHPTHEENMQGLVPDVLEEIKLVIQTIESENGNKEDFFSLFEMVSSKYPKIKNSAYMEPINQFISESLPFAISEEELQKIWE